MSKISDLIPDNKNFNKGSEYGNALIEKSLRKFGAGRSILIDRNNQIIAGNKFIENAGVIGMDDVQIVESDGKRIIAVKRMDIDLDTPQGREMALADNQTALVDIVMDADLIQAELGEALVEEWAVEKNQDRHFTPEFNPGSNGTQLTEEQIQQAKEILDNRFKESINKKLPVICPNCANEFEIDLPK